MFFNAIAFDKNIDTWNLKKIFTKNMFSTEQINKHIENYKPFI